jgi:type IV secretory pathway component VirB8
MNLQDFLTNINNSNQSFKTQNFQSDNYQSNNSYFPREGNLNWPNLINGIKNNKKIRNLLIIAVVVVMVIVIGLIAILLPLIIKIFNYLTTVGISGLIDAGFKFINDLLGTIK